MINNIQGGPYVKCQTIGNCSTGQNKEKIINKSFSKNTSFTRYPKFLIVNKNILIFDFFLYIYETRNVC